MKKNDVVTVEITDISVNGEGIGHTNGYALFVRHAVIGDVVRVRVMKLKRNYGYARIEEIVTPSADRVVPRCALAQKCGGCQIQEMAYEKQLEFKQNKIVSSLIRIGGFSPEFIENIAEPIIGMDEPYHYRNKAQFPFSTDAVGNPVTGFYAGRTHHIVPNTRCVLGAEVNEEILDIILDYMRTYQVPAYDEKTGKGLIRHALLRIGFFTGEIMACLVVNGESLPHADKLISRLAAIEGMASITLSPNTRRDNVIMGNSFKVLWGNGYITDCIGDIRYRISPLSFYQVNPVQTKKIYEIAREYAGLHGTETVWDLYCGIGTISLFLAAEAKQVYGVEVIPQAVEDARKNAEMNGIQNAQFFAGKAEDVFTQEFADVEPQTDGARAPGRSRSTADKCKKDGRQSSNTADARKEERAVGGGSTAGAGNEDSLSRRDAGKNAPCADVIVVDPPRKGCDRKLLETMVRAAPKKIVYVSCDPATLARDAKYLCENGYELRRVRGVDQFPHSVHVETVVLMSIKDRRPDTHINVSLDMDDYHRIIGDEAEPEA